jgi:1-acyl-sn-glycerol-3-phosphate acyltransferase
LLPKILAYAGAITVERTWRADGKDINEKKAVNPNDTENIKIALADGWVITFPQGTTKSFKPVRKGTAHIIKDHQPIVVPIVIDGFRRSFDKKGLRMKKKGILQSFIIKEPLDIDYEKDSIDDIVEKVEYAIEQHPSFLKVIPAEELEEEERLNTLSRPYAERVMDEAVAAGALGPQGGNRVDSLRRLMTSLS